MPRRRSTTGTGWKRPSPPTSAGCRARTSRSRARARPSGGRGVPRGDEHAAEGVIVAKRVFGGGQGRREEVDSVPRPRHEVAREKPAPRPVLPDLELAERELRGLVLPVGMRNREDENAPP